MGRWKIWWIAIVGTIMTVSSGLGYEEYSLNEFDFIVVGAGTAGCAIASRLSESGAYSVLVLERGGDPLPNMTVPALGNSFVGDPRVTQVYNTVPQLNASRETGGIVAFVTGKEVGGGSGHNTMYFNRGSPFDYDNWARITGDQSWKYENVLKYFKKMERYEGRFPFNEEQHGFNGPIPCSRASYAPLLNVTMDAGRYLGFSISDPNGPQRVSFSPIEFAQHKGRRVSSYFGYLFPYLAARPNLKLIKFAEVQNILFQGYKAVGVVYKTRMGKLISAYASKEIIISAGVINSPVILMKSGIGPEDVLNQAKIPPKKLLPVGMNLHDHCFTIFYFIVNGTTTDLFIPERDLTPLAWKEYQDVGDGPYTSWAGIHAQAFLTSNQANKNPLGVEGWADLQFNWVGMPVTHSSEFGKAITSNLKTGEVIVAVLNFLVRPKSRGRLRLNSTDPFKGDPEIDMAYLTDIRDPQVLTNGFKYLLKIIDTPPYKKIGARFPPISHPACKMVPFKSDEYWRCYAQQITESGIHATGVCAMGKEGDADAVLNSKLKVQGIQGLRVVDVSVMPQLTNANTQVPAYMLAEKAAAEILREWEGQKYNVSY